jgi:hypothetical protein
MSRIDRRTFALSCLVLPLTGCIDPNSQGLVPVETQGYPPTIFRNYGFWTNPSVYVATGSVKP